MDYEFVVKLRIRTARQKIQFQKVRLQFSYDFFGWDGSFGGSLGGGVVFFSRSEHLSPIPAPRRSSLVSSTFKYIIHDTIVDRRANHAVVLVTIVVLVVFEHKKNCDCVVVEVEFCGEITRQSPVLEYYIPGGCCIDRRANHNCRTGRIWGGFGGDENRKKKSAFLKEVFLRFWVTIFFLRFCDVSTKIVTQNRSKIVAFFLLRYGPK
jgi:hypothetical protein